MIIKDQSSSLLSHKSMIPADLLIAVDALALFLGGGLPFFDNIFLVLLFEISFLLRALLVPDTSCPCPLCSLPRALFSPEFADALLVAANAAAVRRLDVEFCIGIGRFPREVGAGMARERPDPENAWNDEIAVVDD